MLDDEYIGRNVIAVTFAQEANAYEAFARLEEDSTHEATSAYTASP